LLLLVTQVDLRQTIEAAVEMVAADAVKKGLEIAYSLAPELQQRKILGDTIRIRQVPACCATLLFCSATHPPHVAGRVCCAMVQSQSQHLLVAPPR
jgi:hypothetical protein